jgi:hypothetical protein
VNAAQDGNLHDVTETARKGPRYLICLNACRGREWLDQLQQGIANILVRSFNSGLADVPQAVSNPDIAFG